MKQIWTSTILLTGAMIAMTYTAAETGRFLARDFKLLSKVIFPAKALHFGCVAQRDECNGFPYTAALEWRHAAELVPNTLAAEYFWRQWERVMHLPRRLATPFGVSQVIALPAKVSSAARPVTQRVELLATAA